MGGDDAVAATCMMWAISFRFTAGHVELCAPGWLLGTGATRNVTSYMHRLAAELMHQPDRYGYDPSRSYSVVVQTWDRALSPLPSLAFGRNLHGQDAVRLIPDIYYLHSDGFRALHEDASVAPSWHDRLSTVAWRGSVTGSGPYGAPDEITRVKLALACKRLPDADVALIGVHSTMDGIFSAEAIEAFIAARGLGGAVWDIRSFARYKFVIDIDGHANAWGLLEKLILGCCVLKVASPYEQWFYDRLIPGVHYVPVRADLLDLADVVAWCRDNEDQCASIAHNGALLARSLMDQHQLGRSCEALIAVAHVGSGLDGHTRPSYTADTTTPRNQPDLLDQGRLAEERGDLPGAIALYEAAARTDNDRKAAVALIRQAILCRELGKVAAAVEAAVRAQVRIPDDGMLRLQISQLFSSTGRDIAAVDCLRRAVALAGDVHELRINLADSAVRVGWLDLAFWAVRDLPDDLPHWWPQARRTAMSRYEAARSSAKALLRSRRALPDLSDELSWELAIAFTALGRLRMAERLCAGLIATTSSGPVHDLMSQIIARRSGAAAAIDYLAALSQPLRQEPGWVRRTTRLLLEETRFDELLDLLERHPEVADTFDARFSRAMAFMALDREAALHAHCRRWMEQEPADVLPAGVVATKHPLFDAAEISKDADDIGIVQLWTTPEVPRDILAVMNGWSVRHPGIAHRIVFEEEARAFLHDDLGNETAATYDRCQDATIRADIFRIAWLYVNGGVYVDADEACLRSFGPLLAAGAAAEIMAVRSGDTIGSLRNHFLAARPGSQIMDWALQDAIRALEEAAARGERPSPWHVTGPGLITRAVGRYLVSPDVQTGHPVILLPVQQYRYHARTENDLSFWRKR